MMLDIKIKILVKKKTKLNIEFKYTKITLKNINK